MIAFKSVFHSNNPTDQLWTTPTYNSLDGIEDKIRFQGYLWKIAGNRNEITYKKKYIIITDYHIFYKKHSENTEKLRGEVELQWLQVEFKLRHDLIYPMEILIKRSKKFCELVTNKKKDYDLIQDILNKRCIQTEVWKKYEIDKLIGGAKSNKIYRVFKRGTKNYYALKQIDKDLFEVKNGGVTAAVP